MLSKQSDAQSCPSNFLAVRWHVRLSSFSRPCKYMKHKYITAQNKIVEKSLMRNDCPTSTKMCLPSFKLMVRLLSLVGLPIYSSFLFTFFLKVLRKLALSLWCTFVQGFRESGTMIQGPMKFRGSHGLEGAHERAHWNGTSKTFFLFISFWRSLEFGQKNRFNFGEVFFFFWRSPEFG